MPKHGTTQEAVEGSYVEFQAAVLRALPRDIDADTRLRWTKNGESLTSILRGALMASDSKDERIEEIKILELISGGEMLTIDAVDGSEVIPGSEDMFRAGIDSDFRNWKADESGQPTKETSVAVYEMVADATFSQMFGSVSTDLGKLCFTQHQVKNFIKKYRNWLRADGWATFFLFKSHGHFFVAYVNVHDVGRLYVNVSRLENGLVWSAGHRRRVVFPQLA